MSAPTCPTEVSKALETQVAGREIELLVVERIVGDVHLAVDSAQRAITLQERHCIVIEPGRAALEEGSDDHHLFLPRDGGKPLRGRAGDGLRQIEELGIFALAEILSAEELRQADDVRAAARGFTNPVGGLSRLASGSGEQDICTRPTR